MHADLTTLFRPPFTNLLNTRLASRLFWIILATEPLVWDTIKATYLMNSSATHWRLTILLGACALSLVTPYKFGVIISREWLNALVLIITAPGASSPTEPIAMRKTERR